MFFSSCGNARKCFLSCRIANEKLFHPSPNALSVPCPLSRPIPTDHLPLPSIRPVFPVLQLAAPSTFSYPSPVVESVVICPVGCFISNLFSPILSSRTNSRYFVHLVNFGVSHSFLKQISWYAEIRKSFQVLCQPVSKSPL